MVAAALPDLGRLDIEALRALVVEQHAQRRQAYSAHLEALSAQSHEIERLRLIIEKLKRMMFGAKSEKVSIQLEQLELRLEELETAQAAAEASVEATAAEAKSKSRPSRKPLPAHLPREVVTHHPEQDCCPECGEALRNFGEDVAEILEYIPANFKVIRHVRPKFACTRCERVVEAPAPPRVIERGLAGPGLLAHGRHKDLSRRSPELFVRAGLRWRSALVFPSCFPHQEYVAVPDPVGVDDGCCVSRQVANAPRDCLPDCPSLIHFPAVNIFQPRPPVQASVSDVPDALHPDRGLRLVSRFQESEVHLWICCASALAVGHNSNCTPGTVGLRE